MNCLTNKKIHSISIYLGNSTQNWRKYHYITMKFYICFIYLFYYKNINKLGYLLYNILIISYIIYRRRCWSIENLWANWIKWAQENIYSFNIMNRSGTHRIYAIISVYLHIIEILYRQNKYKQVLLCWDICWFFFNIFFIIMIFIHIKKDTLQIIATNKKLGRPN